MVDRHRDEAPQDAHLPLDSLREATAGRHAAIEDLLDLRRPVGRAHYGRVLQGFAAFLTTWEPRMAAALPERLQAWFAQGRRLHLLQQDLAALHLPQVQVRASTPELPTLGHALGSLYVMEGSALGGQFIAANARRHLDVTPGRGAAYFHGAGHGTAARWREFRALATRELHGDPAALAAAVRSAQQTFEALADTFRTLLHERAAA